jgi:hypothetical protein
MPEPENKTRARGRALRRSERDLRRLAAVTRQRIDYARDLARRADAADFMEAEPVSGAADDEES